MISKLIIRDEVFVSILLCAFFTAQVAAQSPDIFRLEYMLMFKNKADDELSRFKSVAIVHKNMSFYGYAGHTWFQKAVLPNQDRNDIYTLNDELSLYF